MKNTTKKILLGFGIFVMALIAFLVMRGGLVEDGDGDNKAVYKQAPDIYDNFDAYQGEQVEFEGYIISVYECPPCPAGAVCEACLRPYYLVYKEQVEQQYYRPEHIIVRNGIGSFPTKGMKYKIKGKALKFDDPDSQATDVIDTRPENALVVELVEDELVN